MTKNIKRMFFVLTLVTLLATVGAVCAVDDSNSTAAVDSGVSDVATVSETASDTLAAEPATKTSNNKVDTKTIEKEEKNLKKDSITIDGIEYTNIYENQYISDTEFTDNAFFNNCVFTEMGIYFDSNIVLNNCTFTVDSSFHDNYGNITINNVIVKCSSDEVWMSNEGIIQIKGNFTIKDINNQIHNFNEGFIVYGDIPDVINPTLFNSTETIENMTFIKQSTNYGNLTLINPVINAQITNYGNITIINATGSSIINNTNRLPSSSSINNNGYLTAINCSYVNTTINFDNVNNLINCEFINTKTVSVHNGSVINCSFINHTAITNDKYADIFGALRIHMLGFNRTNVSVINSVFENNNIKNTDSLSQGIIGGAAITSSTQYVNLSVNNCTFKNNSVNTTSTWHSYNGGAAIYADNNLTVTNCTFDDNYVESPHGTVTNGGWYYQIMECGMGGAILVAPINIYDHYARTVIIDNNTFTGNNASINGSALYLMGTNNDSNIAITNNIFTDNSKASETIYIRNYIEQVSPNNDGNNYLKYFNPNTNITNNTYINNSFQFKSLNLTAPSKVYSGDNITIALDVELENPQFYDADILEKCDYTWYVNGENITNKQTQMDVQINNTNYITYVTPSISNQRTRVVAITPTVLNDIIITPENINQYVFEGELIVSANSRLIFQGEFNNIGEIYNNKNEVIFDGTNATFTNTAFVIEAQNNTLQNMNINNTDTSDYIITIIGNDNTITNNTLTQYNNQGKTAAIYNNNGENNKITQNTIKVSGPALSITYEGGATTANTQGILSVGGQNNTITYNNITVDNSTDSEQAQFGTIEAITAPAGTNNNISYNNINCTGARFNYGINTLENVVNNQITYNNITVTGYRYTDGIQVGNGANNNLIANNNIKLTCLNDTPVDEAAISYGIIVTSQGGSISDNNTITENTININGAVNYGMEIYTATNTNINNNNITLTGVKSMGIGYAHSPNSTVTNNTITTNDDSTQPLNSVTEEIQPASTGIKIQQDSDNIIIENNTITNNDKAKTDKTIDTTDANTTIKNNKLTSSTGYGDETTKTISDTTLENNTIETTTTIEVPETIITKTPTTITANVTTIDGTPINGGTITFTQGNEAIAQAEVIDGVATATVTFKEEEDATITASYTPESTGLSTSSDEATTSIQAPQTQLNIEDVELAAGETVTLTATVTDQAGNNITGGKIIFKVNGKTVKDTNGKVIYAKVVDGVATVEYIVPDSLAGKDVNITAVYSGSSKYNKESTTITKTVAAQEPTLTITPITDDVQTGSTITLKAKVAAGDKAITTGKIVFKINGKTVKDENGKVIYAKVDANGEVSVDYNLGNLKAGTYTLEATFISPNYDKITSNTTMTVVKA